MNKPFECELVSWEQVDELSRKLAHDIMSSAFRPDVIVAIARGGFVPARLLCDFLDLFNLESIRITHYTAGAHMEKYARLSSPLCADVKGRNVLIVDDVSDTGDTLALALEHIKSFSPAATKIAVLHHKQVSALKPDFYALEIVTWRWLTYPWAVIEDVQVFINDMEPKPRSMEEAAARLKEDYEISVSQQVLHDVYSKMA